MMLKPILVPVKSLVFVKSLCQSERSPDQGAAPAAAAPAAALSSATAWLGEQVPDVEGILSDGDYGILVIITIEH